MRDTLPPGAAADPKAKCPVDPQTRQKWLDATKVKTEATKARQSPTQNPVVSQRIPVRPEDLYRYSLDTRRWESTLRLTQPSRQTASRRAATQPRLDNHREISTIPRALPTIHDRPPNHSELAAAVPPPPSNSEADTGHDAASGNWIYPSQEMFFAAMKRKGHATEAADMSSVVPIHNAVNERAWAEIKGWEQGKADACGGPKLVSFSGDSKALTPRARWNGLLGYQAPFDRHDWVVDRCGRRVDYVIDFYSGKDQGLTGKGLNFYLDVRPKLSSWEGLVMRAQRAVGWS